MHLITQTCSADFPVCCIAGFQPADEPETGHFICPARQEAQRSDPVQRPRKFVAGLESPQVWSAPVHWRFSNRLLTRELWQKY
jgi:hypothetical protein